MAKIHERWGIELGSDEKLRTLKNRLVVLAGSKRPEVTQDACRLIAFNLGMSLDEVAYGGQFGNQWHLQLQTLVEDTTTLFEMAQLIEAILTYTSVYGNGKVLSEVLNKSGCGIQIVKADDDWLTYPTGEEVLDKNVVEGALSFLKGKASKEYGRALEHYRDAKWEECAEKNRRALEEYLRSKLKTEKGLQAAIVELGKRLKTLEHFPEHLRTTIINVFTTLDKNFNGSSKHQSNTFGEEECEYLIYQTGLLMRLLSKIELDSK